MKRLFLLVVTTILLTLTGMAANTKTTVSQVTTKVTLSDNVDYMVTSATPFGDNGMVNIANTDHAVLILTAVKPSAVTSSMLAAHVQIDGAKAVNNTNCQVKLYNRGCIILPYGNSTKPLTVYSEKNFEGESCNDFGLENTGGYMNTLSTKKLNNRISSFKLKRGYMVTFSNRPEGRGYSRCFIAAYDDLEVPELPGVMDNSISSYRIFKWYDAGKPGLANDTRAGAVKDLKVSTCYDFAWGNNLQPDAETVPHHIYEDWPSSAECGRVTYSPHLKTNNEPGNSADDHPQSVETILNNWENLMRTGMRLCSPSSHDGSLGHLREFLDSIDKRGWRCDIVDLHCYWAEGSFYSIKGWVDSYHRPIWISEWVWGASWNNNGIFGEAQGNYRDNPTDAQLNRNRDVVRNICNNLNSWDYVERYYYWNSEANCSKLRIDDRDAQGNVIGSHLTPAGEMYAQLDGGLAYNGKYDYAPKVPTQYDPTNLVVTFDKETNTATLTWHDENGELNVSSTVERRVSESAPWEAIHEVELKEVPDDYEYVDTESVSGYQYRIHIFDANNKERFSKIVMAASDDIKVGDAVQMDGQTKYMGGNMLVNGDFEMSSFGWTNGLGESLSQPWFQVVPTGGANGSAYLQAYGDGLGTTVSAVQLTMTLKPGADYYFSGMACNTNSIFSQFVMKPSATGTAQTVLTFNNPTSNWLTQFKTANAGENTMCVVTLSKLGAKSQFDNMVMAQLFATQEEAIADGMEQMRQKAAAFMAFNKLYDYLNTDLQQKMAAVPSEATLDNLHQLEEVVANAVTAYQKAPRLKALIEHAQLLSALKLYGSDALDEAVEQAQNITSADELFAQLESLQALLDEYMPLTDINNKITNPKFASATGWTTKCGTYTGGDQRTNSKDGVTFWNAWWSGLSASEGTAKTMAIKQEVKDLPHGLYAVECKASTEHYCLSDQHAFISNGSETKNSPALTADYYDLPSVLPTECWQKLTTTPVYVGDDGVVTIGFEGSKRGAIDNAWHRVAEPSNTGDKREGWWCATDFVLKFHPMYKRVVEPNQWGVICLPYAIRPAAGVKLYWIAGINPDYTQLCLEEISEVPAGKACLYRCEQADATFLEYGKEVAFEQEDAPGNLRGFFRTTKTVGKNYYYLANGQWVKAVEERPRMTDYTGIIRPFNDSGSQWVPVIENWSGETMPIVGVTDEEKAANAAGISDVLMPTTVSGKTYDLGGRQIDQRQPVKGVYIINGKKIIK